MNSRGSCSCFLATTLQTKRQYSLCELKVRQWILHSELTDDSDLVGRLTGELKGTMTVGGGGGAIIFQQEV